MLDDGETTLTPQPFLDVALPMLVVLASSDVGQVGKVIALDGTVSIGRSRTATIAFDDSGLSRLHVEIVATNTGCRIRDLGSRNGTRVNGATITELELHQGDQIQLGGTLLQIQLGNTDIGVPRNLDGRGVALWEYHVDRDDLVFSEHIDKALDLPPSTLGRKHVKIASCIHAEDLGRFQRALGDAGTTPVEIEVRILAPPTFERWVLLRGRPASTLVIVGSVVDVTAVKRREATLTRTSKIVESLVDGVALTDVSGAIVDLNASMARILGVDSKVALGRKLTEVIPVTDAAATARAASEAIASQGRWTTSLQFAKDVFVEALAFPLRTERDEEAGVVWVFRDVSETHRMATQIAFLDRLASLGTLSAGIAHEISNPLSYILHNAELIREELGEDRSHLIAMVTDIVSGAQRIAGIVRDLKRFARGDEKPTLEPIDVKSVVQLALDMTGHVLRSRARVITLVDPVRAEASESRLSQVLVNLLVNAAQAIPAGNVGEATITVWAREEDGGVAIDVIDTGVGMPAEVAARAFEPYFTTKGLAGSGLGLSISHGLVTSMGGTIKLTSSPSGTRARVWLRSARPEPKPTLPPTRKNDATIETEARLRILVIDDEPLVARSLARILRPHDVAIADGYTSGLKRLVDQQEPYDAIVCDVMMPDGTGIELHERVAADRPALAAKFVFITGGTFTEAAQEFLRTTTNPHLLKPVNTAVLRKLLQDIGRR